MAVGLPLLGEERNTQWLALTIEMRACSSQRRRCR